MLFYVTGDFEAWIIKNLFGMHFFLWQQDMIQILYIVISNKGVSNT